MRSPPIEMAHLPPPAPPPDEVDPDLVALPDPPRGTRTATLVVLALTMLASFAMALAVARDAAYVLAPAVAVDIGELRAESAAGAGSNRHVRATGMLGAVGSIRYERPFQSDSYRMASVAGHPDVWVELRVPAGQEGGRYVPPATFTGRLVRFEQAGPRHRGLRSAIQDTTGEMVPAGAWLLVDGEAPDDARWAVALVALFLGFAAWNARALLRLVRRVDT